MTAVPEGFADVLAVIRALLRPLHIACQREELVVKRWASRELRWEE